MINTILCFVLGHKMHYKGEFRVVELGRTKYYPIRRTNVFRCYRCGCEIERKTK